MTCAFAVRGALKKFSGVESVDVSLNKGLAIVKLKPGNTVMPEPFWEAMRKNGFTPKETSVVVRGDVLSTGGKMQLKVTGTSRTYDLLADTKSPQVPAGKNITIEGTLMPERTLRASVPLRVESLGR